MGGDVIRRCDRCGREYDARTVRSRYCSKACRNAADRARHRVERDRRREAVVVPDVAEPHVGDEEVAVAVVTVKGTLGTFSAVARGAGSPYLAPMCSRLADRIGGAIEDEGL